MNNYPYGIYPKMGSMPVTVANIDPYVVETLKTIIGNRVVVETVRGSLHGELIDVKPDHIVVGEPYGDTRFFIRIQEIVYVMPDVD